MTPEDQALYAIVSTAAPATIGDVLAVMHQIDAVLPDTDGLKWFNRLYMTVTEQVDFHPPAAGWKDTAWLLKLDVVFASLYFSAVAASLNADPAVPSSWQALMQFRRVQGIDRIQFALAGMNAHINHDLSLALIATGDQTHIIPSAASPQHADYLAVNDLLNAVMPAALTMLATDTLGVLAQDTGKIGRLLAFWNLSKARDLAWDFSIHLRPLHPIPRTVALRSQDQLTGVIGRAILAFT